MNLTRAIIVLSLGIVLGVPLLFRPDSAIVPPGAATLVIVTPHNEQIRYEFGRAFNAWHQREHGQPVVIDWRRPGGTSEIRKLLIHEYAVAIERGKLLPDGRLLGADDKSFPLGTMSHDLFFGGGSYEHNQMIFDPARNRGGAKGTPPGGSADVGLSISVPAGLSQELLDDAFGPHVAGEPPRVGREPLYQPAQHWIGTALSGFGIVFNRDALQGTRDPVTGQRAGGLGVPDPKNWDDMTDPRLTGWVALADPRQSGSVTTTYNSILDNLGWDEGWRVLRDMCANARYFTNNATKVPIDVSHGEAAVGVAIDFYGRYESQAVRQPGELPSESRVGYINPPGMTYIDPDPISLLRGGPALADEQTPDDIGQRFIIFCLSDEAQALWQFPSRGEEPGLGPHEYELRRMPVTRSMYTSHADRFIDELNPWGDASSKPYAGWRSLISELMPAFSIAIHAEHVDAWRALNRARAGSVDAETLEEMERLYYAMPTIEVDVEGERVPMELSAANYRAIRSEWMSDEARSSGRYDRVRIEITEFFRQQYRRVVALERDAGAT
ncbi:MAG: ABC transporter substrate-binding protein [Planctomycetota bacterium]